MCPKQLLIAQIRFRPYDQNQALDYQDWTNILEVLRQTSDRFMIPLCLLRYCEGNHRQFQERMGWFYQNHRCGQVYLTLKLLLTDRPSFFLYQSPINLLKCQCLERSLLFMALFYCLSKTQWKYRGTCSVQEQIHLALR